MTRPGFFCVSLGIVIAGLAVAASSLSTVVKGTTIDVSTIISWQCLRNHTIVVAVNWVDLAKFKVWTGQGPKLHLLDRHCKPHPNVTHLIWTIAEGQCGSQVVLEGGRKSISNVITSQTDRNASHSSHTETRVILCNYPMGNVAPNATRDVVHPTDVGSSNPDIVLRWSIHRGNGRKLGNRRSDLTGRSAVVRQWRNGLYMYIKLDSVDDHLASKYDSHVHMTFQSCALQWHQSNAVEAQKNFTHYLIRQGCSASNDYLFDHTESHHSHSVILYFNLTKAMFIPRPLRHQKYVQVLCNATLCFPSPEDRELVDLDLPMCSSYYGTSARQRKCKPMEDPRRPAAVQRFLSNPFIIREQRPLDPCSNLDCSDVINDTDSALCRQYNCTKWGKMTAVEAVPAAQTVNPDILVPVEVSEPDSDSDSSVVVDPVIVIVACIVSFFCGGILVGILWLIQRHLSAASTIRHPDTKPPASDEVETCNEIQQPSLWSGQPPVLSASACSQ